MHVISSNKNYKSLYYYSVKSFVFGLFFLENETWDIGPLYLQIASLFFIERSILEEEKHGMTWKSDQGLTYTHLYGCI